jgi:hypothetical protein
MRFVLIQKATQSPLASQLDSVLLGRIAVALEVQLNSHVSPEWGGNYTVRVSDGKDLQAEEIPFFIVDNLPDAPGAIAYHDNNSIANAECYIALSMCNNIDDVTTGISHECCETAGDPDCNEWCADGNGNYFARELCDAVESTKYPIDLGDEGPQIMVSDFVLQSFFSIGGQAPYSYVAAHGLGSGPSVPFGTAPGGYQVTFQFQGNTKQIWGKRAHSAHAIRMKHWGSRSNRRLRQIDPNMTITGGK